MAIARPFPFHDTMPVSRRSLRVPRDGLILLGFVGLILAINPRGFIGGGTDDWQYLEAARCWVAHGPCVPTQHWATRWPLIAPLSIAIGLLGESRLIVGLVPLVYSLAAVALIRHLALRLFGTAASLIAGIAFLATPMVGLSLLHPNIDIVELTFLLAALAASIAASDHRSRSAALFAGVMLALAVQSRETGFAYIIVAGAAFLCADRETRRILFWAVPGFVAPIAVEMAAFTAMFGDPLARYAIALHHTAVPSTALAAGVDVSRGPLLNPAVIAGWRPVSGIDVHWTINPVINLLAHAMIGPTLMAAAVLIIARRRAVPRPHALAATRLLIAALGASAILIYVLAIDPLPRMFLPLAAAAALAIGALSPRSLAMRADAAVLVALAVLLVIALATIARQPTMLRADTPAARIVAAHTGAIAIDTTSRRALALVSGVRALPGIDTPTRWRLAVAQHGCEGRQTERIMEVYPLSGPWFAPTARYRGPARSAPMFALCLFERGVA
ncbi:dolichyl-phosphate-mannose-protein mannosyltransferase [Hephaestia caeni]|uniref:Dolichyl-phosphate-mannose-protein mannosyltransferase n=1 Tax=Hephaestia caeni TaxID=645617 RepID=A0A397P7Z0_9SPHN|nr:glycosyltransferase family 39 protein [Hephaestia caeni]RIA45660.1 dolichyl-phosphate-mannose-protein mannosyltransferase [Hephaestia caeni]